MAVAVLAMIDWSLVIVAAIGAVPATIGAWAALQNGRKLRTPSGTSIGKQVEAAHHTSIASNYRLQAMGGELGVKMPHKAQDEERYVERLNTID